MFIQIFVKGLIIYMNFVFPQNYKYRYKFWGILDFSTVFINLTWAGLTYIIAKLLFSSLTFRIYFFIIFYFPVFLLSITGFHGENVFSVILYIYGFKKNCKIYLYK